MGFFNDFVFVFYILKKDNITTFIKLNVDHKIFIFLANLLLNQTKTRYPSLTMHRKRKIVFARKQKQGILNIYDRKKCLRATEYFNVLYKLVFST